MIEAATIASTPLSRHVDLGLPCRARNSTGSLNQYEVERLLLHTNLHPRLRSRCFLSSPNPGACSNIGKP
jgi:hypothetical protein